MGETVELSMKIVKKNKEDVIIELNKIITEIDKGYRQGFGWKLKNIKYE